MKWRDRLRNEIRKGEFVETPTPVAASATETEIAVTFADVVKAYRERYVNVPTRRKSAIAMFNVHLNMLLRASVPTAKDTTTKLEDIPIAAITKAHVEAIRAARRAELAKAHEAWKGDEAAAKATRKVRRPGAKDGEVGINRLLARLRHVFSWAVEEGYVDASPFKKGGVTVIRLEHRAESPRTRRLEPDQTDPKTGDVAREGEERRLLKHAGPHLRALIVAALNTGCRQGELLSLEWWQVRLDDKGLARELHLPATHTKTHEARVIPIGPRLRAELAMRRHAPDGQDLPLTARVFGNEVGEPVTTIREAWEETCTAAGIEDLHFHDLRREFACRLLEAKTDLHDVREFLGHANITTTSTYLRSTSARLARALDRLDPEPQPAATPTTAPSSPDSHTIRTNQAEDTNGQHGGLAVTH
jgi:integrase